MDFVRFIFGAMTGIMRGFKAPYVLIAVVMATAAACYMMIHPHLGVEKAAYGFAAILAGGFGTKALLAVMIRALKTAIAYDGSGLDSADGGYHGHRCRRVQGRRC